MNKIQQQIYELVHLIRPSSITAEKLSGIMKISVRRIKYNATLLRKKDIGFDEEMTTNGGKYCYSLGYYIMK